MNTAESRAIDPLITNAAPGTEPWPDLFPLPGGYSVEPQPLTDKQLGELTALWRSNPCAIRSGPAGSCPGSGSHGPGAAA